MAYRIRDYGLREECRVIATQRLSLFLETMNARIDHSDLSGTGRSSIRDNLPVRARSAHHVSYEYGLASRRY